MINEIPRQLGPVADSSPQPVQPPVRVAEVARNAGAGKAAAEKPFGGDEQVNRAQAEQLANGLQELVQSVHRQLSFKVDDDTGGTVIQVIDAETDQVLRQIPSEAIVALQRRLAEFQESNTAADKRAVDGVLFSTRV